MPVDITRHLDATEREVSVREHAGRPAHVVTIRRTYDTEIADVWDALTNPERLPRWFLPVTGELHRGGRYQLEGNAGGEVVECEPPRRLSLTWVFGGDTSWVDVVLTAVDEGSTRLQLEHMAHTPPQFWERYGPGATGVGWDLALLGLGEHLAGVPAVDPEQAEQWPTTDDGRKFAARCSASWGEAATAAGTPASAALAAAANTLAFYTGRPEPHGST